MVEVSTSRVVLSKTLLLQALHCIAGDNSACVCRKAPISGRCPSQGACIDTDSVTVGPPVVILLLPSLLAPGSWLLAPCSCLLAPGSFLLALPLLLPLVISKRILDENPYIYFKDEWSIRYKYALASVSQSLPKTKTNSSAVTIPAWDLQMSNSSSMLSLNTHWVLF